MSAVSDNVSDKVFAQFVHAAVRDARAAGMDLTQGDLPDVEDIIEDLIIQYDITDDELLDEDLQDHYRDLALSAIGQAFD